ncbi:MULTISPECIES: hypothetical protein [Albidovulum]|nr:MULTISPECIES: hypothetical protein [Defluviimonas]MCW3783477.1 hypothetical protein [Defluviimonas salinarum]
MTDARRFGAMMRGSTGPGARADLAFNRRKHRTTIARHDMKILRRSKRFAADEDGAVTVDWVVLTAGACALSVATMLGMKGSMNSVGDAVKRYLDTRTVPETIQAP